VFAFATRRIGGYAWSSAAPQMQNWPTVSMDGLLSVYDSLA
jgi:hypothetical protein